MAERIGRYEIVETLGKGGMGTVYRARDPELQRDVAIKVVLSWAQFDSDALARFNREAQVVAGLHHPHIVTVYDAGRTEDGLPYFVMQFLEGTDLREILEREGRLPTLRALRYMLQVCDGVAYAHEREIVHRDLKPANLLVTPDDQVKIVDFGIAMLVGSRITGSGVSLGTPLYMAPEQVAGEQVDWRADIFALGGVLYTLLGGRSPFEAPTLGSICNKIVNEEPPPLRSLGVDVPSGIEAVIERALEKDRDRRYQSVPDVARELRSLLDDLEAEATQPTRVMATREMREVSGSVAASGSRRRKIALVAVALLVLVGALWALPNLDRGAAEEVEPASLVERTGEAKAAESEEDVAADAEGADAADDAGERGDAGGSLAERERGGGGADARPDDAVNETPTGGAVANPGERRFDAAGETSQGPVDEPMRDTDYEPGFEDRPVTLYPASPMERGRVSREVAKMVRALESRDREALASVFGGQILPRQRRTLQRYLEGPRVQIKHNILDVSSTSQGTVVAQVGYDMLFVGAPGTVPAPRRGEWVMVFQPDGSGGLHLRAVRPR